jgi:hypothetical protein
VQLWVYGTRIILRTFCEITVRVTFKCVFEEGNFCYQKSFSELYIGFLSTLHLLFALHTGTKYFFLHAVAAAAAASAVAAVAVAAVAAAAVAAAAVKRLLY